MNVKVAGESENVNVKSASSSKVSASTEHTSNRVRIITSKGAEISLKETSQPKVKLAESNQTFFRNGKSPYIDETTGTWWVFDDKSQCYVDTNIQAKTGVEVDSELSLTSYNPVQNKVVTKEVNDKVDEEDIKELKAIDIDVLWEAL